MPPRRGRGAAARAMSGKNPASAPPKLDRSIVMVGLMGAGKSAIGNRLAKKLGLPFVDADTEIERAAGCSVEEIFERYGEPAFRDGERRVIRRLLNEETKVLATGGGAFLDAGTRRLIKRRGVSVWLRAELDVLVSRTSRRDNRPLLKRGDPREILEKLIEERYPVYAEADVIVDVSDEAPDTTTNRVLAAILDFVEAGARAGAAT
jgi:shikimate kinase